MTTTNRVLLGILVSMLVAPPSATAQPPSMAVTKARLETEAPRLMGGHLLEGWASKRPDCALFDLSGGSGWA